MVTDILTFTARSIQAPVAKQPFSSQTPGKTSLQATCLGLKMPHPAVPMALSAGAQGSWAILGSSVSGPGPGGSSWRRAEASAYGPF